MVPGDGMHIIYPILLGWTEQLWSTTWATASRLKA
jgi:hypothetical protein